LRPRRSSVIFGVWTTILPRALAAPPLLLVVGSLARGLVHLLDPGGGAALHLPLVRRGAAGARRPAGDLLARLRANIDEPIAAILTLNTIAHTVGAAMGGAIALEVFGSRWIALFSAVLTLAILVFSEILPKTIGATFWQRLAPVWPRACSAG
jgi:hypothetical protein